MLLLHFLSPSSLPQYLQKLKLPRNLPIHSANYQLAFNADYQIVIIYKQFVEFMGHSFFKLDDNDSKLKLEDLKTKAFS